MTSTLDDPTLSNSIPLYPRSRTIPPCPTLSRSCSHYPALPMCFRPDSHMRSESTTPGMIPLDRVATNISPPPKPAAFIPQTPSQMSAPSTRNLPALDDMPPMTPAALLQRPRRHAELRGTSPPGWEWAADDNSRLMRVNPSNSGLRSSLLTDAAFRGDLETVEMLLERGLVDVDDRSKSGASALSIASAAGNLEIVRLLLMAGADPNVQGKVNGQTPLIRSLHSTDGTPLNRLPNGGFTSRVGIIQLLIDAKVCTPPGSPSAQTAPPARLSLLSHTLPAARPLLPSSLQ